MAIGITRKTWEKIGESAGWRQVKKVASHDIDQIHKNMDEFHATTQNLFPDQADFAVDPRKNRISITTGVKDKINRALHGLGSHHKSIPLSQITAILKANDVVMLQEDGTLWSGFVMPTGECGETDDFGQPKNKPFTFELAHRSANNAQFLPCDNVLVMTACTMGRGTIEIVTYIS